MNHRVHFPLAAQDDWPCAFTPGQRLLVSIPESARETNARFTPPHITHLLFYVFPGGSNLRRGLTTSWV